MNLQGRVLPRPDGLLTKVRPMSDEGKKWPFLYDFKGWNAEAKRQDDGTWKVVILDARRNPKREYMSIEEKTEQEQLEKDSQGLIERLKTVLGEQVEDVRASSRLTDSPACLVVGDQDMGAQMRRIMEAAGQEVPVSKPILEVNPTHPLVERMDAEADEDRFADLAAIIFDQAKLAEGGQLDDPAAYVARLNKLLLQLSE